MSESVLDISRPPVPAVVAQHVEDAAMLRNTRTRLASAPHVKLHHLGRFDERLAAHLDGVAVAGECGRKLARAALESPGIGTVFVATIAALQSERADALDRELALAEAAPDATSGLTSALGWVSPPVLKGIGGILLQSSIPFRQRIGITACALHRIDAGDALDTPTSAADPGLRARALRCAGEVGRRDLMDACAAHARDADPACAFWAAWSAAMLGDRRAAVAMLTQIGLSPGRFRLPALCLALKILGNQEALALLKRLAADAGMRDLVIDGAGIAGDPYYVPWLVKQMNDLKAARLAGEAFSLITGVDLASHGLDRKPPEDVEHGPTENPADFDVGMDRDDGLPWPDAGRIQQWWDANEGRFRTGVRYFMGEPVNIDNCKRVLREGYQRQRIAAAQYLCLLRPGTVLFNCAAPAWRQQRLLAQLQ